MFPDLILRGRPVCPVIQGGMGVGISAHQLAGAVAKEGAVGTIASVDLRRLHPDLMRKARKCRDQQFLADTNVEALDREIRSAREIAGPEAFIAVNIMRALSNYVDLVKQACHSGANALIVGAGLPFELPDIVDGSPDIALIPIVSEERGAHAILKKWLRKGRAPDAIIVEHPRYAGGHLGATRLDEVDDSRFDFPKVLTAIRALLDSLGLGDKVPLIPAGGVNSFNKIRELFALGASGVQVGTAFAVTKECDAHPNFKKVLAEARPEEIVTFMSSAGLPARAVLTPWLKRYLGRERRLRDKADPECSRCPSALGCLSHCGFKDGNPAAGQFCIEAQLAAAQGGNINQGLFFRGAAPLPFGRQIRSVAELLAYLLRGTEPSEMVVGA